MSIESLKEAARAHEQKEEWGKALDQYKKAIEELAKEEQPDIGLYNRVADLQVRQGQIQDAVLNYEQAINLYLEADLPNNAIGVCKKIVRNMPMRHSVYLRMGQIRGQQGLIADARQNFLTYAERMQAEGNIDEGLRALGELADLAPDEVDIRLAIATQMQSHGRTDDAIAQLQAGHRQASLKGLATAPFEAMLEQLGSAPGAAPVKTAAPSHDDVPELDDILPSAPALQQQKKEEPVEVEVGGFEISLAPPEGEEAEAEEEAEDDSTPLPTFDFDSSDEIDEETADPLPMFGGDENEEEADTDPLPMFGGDEDEEEADTDPLPMFGGDEEEEADALPTFDLGDELEEAPALDASAFGESDQDEREGIDTIELPELEIPISLDAPPPIAPLAPLASPPPAAPSGPIEGLMEDAQAEKRAATPVEPSAGTPARPAAPPARPATPGAPFITDPMGHASLAAKGDIRGAMNALRVLIKSSPDNVQLRQGLVDYALRLNDQKTLVPVLLELAEALEHTGQGAKAGPVYQQVLSVEPQNARALQGVGGAPKAAESKKSEDYVDLESMLLGDDEEEKTTRFVVAYEEPTGDEQADFAKMLSQFKAKVAESFSADDVQAHQDLGTAYKEMGLVDEAISEFQQALRASAEHLPTYELLGQCFMEKGEPEAAVRTLTRALSAPFQIEDELLGMYYWLGRAHEQTGNKPHAVEFYDRVFSLDINFADVTERLRALR